MRFSLSLIAFVYLGIVAAVPLPDGVPVNPLPGTTIAGLRLRNVGSQTLPLSLPTSAIPPAKVPRGDSDVFGDVLDAAGKGGKGGKGKGSKKGAIGMARRESVPTGTIPQATVSVPSTSLSSSTGVPTTAALP